MTNSENGNFIKVYRSLLDWEWYHDTNTTRVFIHLLLTANYKETQWQGITLLGGQRVVSYPGLARELNLSIQQARTCLNRLKSTGEITSKSTNKYTVVTLVNYAKFQQSITGKATDKITGNQQAINRQATTVQEVKNIRIKELKNKTYSSNHELDLTEFEQFWSLYPRRQKKKEAIKSFEKVVKGGVAPGDVIAGAKRFADWCKRNNKEPQYIPLPTTWLNQGQWEDELMDDVFNAKQPNGNAKTFAELEWESQANATEKALQIARARREQSNGTDGSNNNNIIKIDCL